jgi:hypothetical protein
MLLSDQLIAHPKLSLLFFQTLKFIILLSPFHSVGKRKEAAHYKRNRINRVTAQLTIINNSYGKNKA